MVPTPAEKRDNGAENPVHAGKLASLKGRAGIEHVHERRRGRARAVDEGHGSEADVASVLLSDAVEAPSKGRGANRTAIDTIVPPHKFGDAIGREGDESAPCGAAAAALSA